MLTTGKVMRIRRKKEKKTDDGKRPLVRNMESHVLEGDVQPEGANKSGGESKTESFGVQEQSQLVLDLLKQILSGGSGVTERSIDLLRSWKNMHVVPSTKKSEEAVRYPEDWLQQLMFMLDEHFMKCVPNLPSEGAPGKQLKVVERLSLLKGSTLEGLRRLTPLLKETKMFRHFIDRYNFHIFQQLDLMLDRDLSVESIFLLLQWTKQSYFSQDIPDHHDKQDNIPSPADPLVLTQWFERARKKLMTRLQIIIPVRLQKILDLEERRITDQDFTNEEAFNCLFLDVIQCLNAFILGTEQLSHSLKCEVQRLCNHGLIVFVQSYKNIERQFLKKESRHGNKCSIVLHLFRAIHNCRQLRNYASKMVDANNNSHSSVELLEVMENEALASLRKTWADLAQSYLRDYFAKEDVHFQTCKEMIKKPFAALPTATDQQTKMILVGTAYDCVVLQYIRCLMKGKFKHLRQRWGFVGERVNQDAIDLQTLFSHLTVGCTEKHMFLLKIGEILEQNSVDNLKMVCAVAMMTYPDLSKEHLPALLRWKGVLSRQQVSEVLAVSWEACEDSGIRVKRHHQNYCCCWPCANP